MLLHNLRHPLVSRKRKAERACRKVFERSCQGAGLTPFYAPECTLRLLIGKNVAGARWRATC